jgi:hypothetical protein
MMINKREEGKFLFAEGKLEEAESCFLSVIEEDSIYKSIFFSCGALIVISEIRAHLLLCRIN